MFNLTASEVKYDSSNMFQVSSFDNIGTAMLSIFIIFTSDGWNIYLYNLMDIDSPIIGVIFCIFTRIFFMFFLLNMIFAIIVSAFISIQKT